MRNTHLVRLALAFIALLFGFAIPRAVWAQSALENPPNGGPVSGIGVVSGWKCTAGTLTYTVDNGPPAQLAYGISREDTQGVCGHSNTGFIAEQNWNLTGDGQHTIRVFDNGQQFAQATFTVTTFGTEFLTGVNYEQTVLAFPNTDTTTYLKWQENAQNFVITGAVPNTDFPNILGFYQISGSETLVGCTNPAFNGTTSHQIFLPLHIQLGPAFRGTAFQSNPSGGFATSAVTGKVSPSGHIDVYIITDSYTSAGTFIATGTVFLTGSIEGKVLQGTYSGGFIAGETCSVSGAVSGVRS